MLAFMRARERDWSKRPRARIFWRMTLLARRPALAFDAVPAAWFGGHHVVTQLSNAIHLLFPAGERFFVRSVMRYVNDVPAPLAATVRAFSKQEGSHAREHERFFENLRARGYAVDRFLDRYKRTLRAFERIAPAPLRLSVTAALEHYTALFAEDALARDVLHHSDKAMRHLLVWHAVEELEHKSVAFDVLRCVARSYALRIFGLAVATIALSIAWVMSARALLAGDGISTWQALRALRRRDPRAPTLSGGTVFRGALAYLHPRFHPAGSDERHGPLIAQALATLRSEGALT
jgi:uncharacterized protein